MFTVFVKDFIHGTVSEKNVPIERVIQLFLDWSNGKDIVVNNYNVANLSIESVRVEETGRNDL